ncbi:phosphoribosylamine--glycine ligase [Zavarzinia compransoris]|uniref:Phosphoribosylamine--glycine ligase n=1 Tax=Zavarzinia compransoris TaxID=1264899 RepID=A0A317E8W7_9PROT|nr:phosphoribosylamine--glycine ligase [Zavarzinia compransoris]PWR23548.1 phosphoribosylamine--glycine ligase [Zavarzinia compransoris]TDP47759.1 phosphoribosylamine--glycine ligase [Zavarzinia compransoris]
MNVLVIGSGGREHALCWALAKSPLVTRLFCAPGNGGIAQVATCIDLDPKDSERVLALVRSEKIDFVVVGPEAPLVIGLVDKLSEKGVKVFGPTAAAAQLEGSKGFTKDLCARHDIPTAAYGRFHDKASALAYLAGQPIPVVIKADGLAAGKGVVIATTRDEAVAAVEDCFAGRFGSAGSEIVIEAFMTGEEASFFAIADGRHVVALGSAQDHKRVFDHDEGPNTGGMGAVAPSPLMTPAMVDEVMARIIRPTVAAMAAEGRPFKGVLYAGLMLTAEGPQLIEYNVRFGDPECQVLLARMQTDLLPVLIAAAEGVLDKLNIEWDPRPAVTVVMATRGYPGDLLPGGEIRGLEAAGAVPGVTVFHAATRAAGDHFVPTGGRVLNVTALGETITAARETAYRAVARIDWPGGFNRTDIALKAIAAAGEG